MLTYYSNSWYPVRNYGKVISLNKEDVVKGKVFISFKTIGEGKVQPDASSILITDMESSVLSIRQLNTGVKVYLDKPRFNNINLNVFFNKLTY